MNEIKKEKYIRALFPELKLVSDKDLSDKACAIWVWFWEHSEFSALEDAPFMSGKQPLHLIEHVQCVVKCAVAMAGNAERVQGSKIDVDALIITAVLHDVSKLIEYHVDSDGNAAFTQRGKDFPHAFFGAAKALEFGLPDKIAAGILNHPVSSPLQLHTNESEILCCADLASARMK